MKTRKFFVLLLMISIISIATISHGLILLIDINIIKFKNVTDDSNIYILYNKEKLNTYSTSLNAPVNDISKNAVENEIKSLENGHKFFRN